MVDGPGLRTSIYFAGCRHACPGCHNPSSWSFYGGEEMSIEEIIDVISEADLPVTLSGGDPLYQAPELTQLCIELKKREYNVWCYTGFKYEEIAGIHIYSELLQNIDVLVDGPFIESLRDISLLFRGSSNQRLIDVAHSTADSITLWQPDW